MPRRANRRNHLDEILADTNPPPAYGAVPPSVAPGLPAYQHCAYNSGVGSVIVFCVQPQTSGIWCEEHAP
jgi:hypothetical protein